MRGTATWGGEGQGRGQGRAGGSLAVVVVGGEGGGRAQLQWRGDTVLSTGGSLAD